MFSAVLVLLAAPMVVFAPRAAAEAGVVPTIAGPVQVDHATATGYAKRHPGSVPDGVNDFGCRSDAHPRPVVLLHGTDSDAYSDWAGIAPRLLAERFCVFALNYGGVPDKKTYGLANMRDGVRQLGAFVARVRAATGAAKVDLIGYSQGATVARAWVNRGGGAAAVGRWVGLASPTYGGVFYGLAPVVASIPGGVEASRVMVPEAVVQQMQDSPFLAELNAGGDTVQGVAYTTIGSRVDEMIQPHTNIALRDSGATNLLVQDLCPLNGSGHFRLPYDPFTQVLVVNALDPVRTVKPRCEPVPLGEGIAGVIAQAHS